ncbi:glycosyltransferase [Flavobacterium sp. NST-5]|uniref:Glycosyltransferase n=1 Tax=Flavobacterium ichthyis TaxID=2698827 RepID=A0ABW9Z895_9FLAO|nr:glycosyltransferase family A protein [Flavobacterium ichthyis]NBL64844.1 glycosyltransferase [Flavobacterium ichthyis]
MIIFYHQDQKVTRVFHQTNRTSVSLAKFSLGKTLFILAKMFPNDLIVWCHESQKENLNLKQLPEIFHHQKIMASYHPSQLYFPDSIGYVEESPFIKVKKVVKYPTWQMSSLAGGIHASILNEIKFNAEDNFDYLLCSIAKMLMPQGLLCYSEPRMLVQSLPNQPHENASLNQLFRFVKQHYRTRWVFLLFLNFFLYERKFPVVALFRTAFLGKRTRSISLEHLPINSTMAGTPENTVDVIIPTIGRKPYLYNVLCDFRQQTHLPKKIIIVEQNPLPDSTSELDYLTKENWPFEIEHIFTHQAGACNARNVALSKIAHEWVFMADDDIRFERNFLYNLLQNINNTGNKIATISCLQQGEEKIYQKIIQWSTFGSGTSIVKRHCLNNIKFNMALEFGYGEDMDFGMQLRNAGYDVIYLPFPEILHLKAPMGGFRIKPTLPWQNETIQPKPSPTVMLFKKTHLTPQQLMGYKTILFFKFYSRQSIKNPVRYFREFKKRWKSSMEWACFLEKKSTLK